MSKPMLDMEVDITSVMKMLDDFDQKESKKAIRTALRRTGARIQKLAKSNLRARVKDTTKRTSKYNDRLIDAVRNKVYKDSKGNLYFKTHVMGTRKTGSGTYRARFFEGGTRLRTKGHNRGKIKATHFFRDAYQGFEANLSDTLYRELAQAITKINSKKY